MSWVNYFALRYIVSVTHQFPGTEHRATPCRSLSRFAVEASTTYSVTEFRVCLICIGYLVVPGMSGQGTSKFPSWTNVGTRPDGDTLRMPKDPRWSAMSVPRVRKLPPVVVLAILDVVVVHSSEPDLLGNGVNSAGIGYKPGLSGGLGRYIPGWG